MALNRLIIIKFYAHINVLTSAVLQYLFVEHVNKQERRALTTSERRAAHENRALSRRYSYAYSHPPINLQHNADHSKYTPKRIIRLSSKKILSIHTNVSPIFEYVKIEIMFSCGYFGGDNVTKDIISHALIPSEILLRLEK